MPEYLAPGVYVEETSFRAKSIEGVSTTTTGFVGPCRYGPVDGEPELLTSLVEFERVYGDRQRLAFGRVGDTGEAEALPLQHNYLWHAVRAFFEEGGKRLYAQRAFRPLQTAEGAVVAEGFARWPEVDGSPAEPLLRIRARHPGVAGNRRVRLAVRFGQNMLTGTDEPRLNGALEHDVVWVSQRAAGSPPGQEAGRFCLLARTEQAGRPTWQLRPETSSPADPVLELADLVPDSDPSESDQVRLVTLTVIAYPTDEDGVTQVWEDLPLDPRHQRAGAPDSVSARLAAHPGDRGLERSLPLVVELGSPDLDGLDVLGAVLDAFDDADALRESADPASLDEAARSVDLSLTGGDDGERPTTVEYAGAEDLDTGRKSGLVALEDVEDISIVAAPGATFGYGGAHRAQATAVTNALVSHAARMRYRIAVLDSGDKQAVRDVRAMKAAVDSTYAAFYYPWIRILDPVTQREITVPPSGFVAGIYARNDVERAVYKAPANEVVRGALGLETVLSTAQQDVLNPEGVNCFRFFEGRGYRLWGARTTSSDPEWKYVNLRRYFIYLERSIDRGTQWAVFEPNGERLWANVRRSVEDFLLAEFQSGALLGARPEHAYFVKCDRSTMTQNDLDNGRLVCLVGVAALRPAEFVVMRIGQWTLQAR